MIDDRYFSLLELDKYKKNGYYPSLLVGKTVEYGDKESIRLTSPIDNTVIGEFRAASSKELDLTLNKTKDAFKVWRMVPAPKRGELVRCIGEIVRKKKEALAYIITLETGKIYAESLGEVQEWIDICDFAVGVSRQLYGLTIASERPNHRMMEQWHPLGVVGIITAFNFPMAVWAWNAMLALVCGDTLVWKPSNRAILSSLAIHNIVMDALESMPELPQNISSVIVGGNKMGEAIARHKDIALLSATGSVPMGMILAPIVAQRLGKVLLELGGNNAMILTPSADLELALRAIVFSAVGTAGQRCTTLRRLIVHKSIKERVTQSLIKAYMSLSIGSPLDKDILIGPLIDEKAYIKMQEAIETIRAEGGELLYGGEKIIEDVPEGGIYVRPALVSISHQAPILCNETFAPILYIIEYETLDEAIAIHNAVPQGLSSAIFTNDFIEAETFLSPKGSDCGISNVNIGTSGAEIGGAFGGEKATGGGRESGSDAWKSYMRRSTNTINYGMDIPLAQGIEFKLS